MASHQFNLEHIALLNRGQAECEALVADHFRIPALPSSLYPYEIATLSELNQGERSRSALAHLVIYQRERPKGSRVEHLYRVCLMDDLILERAQEEPDDWLRSLLCYIMTHELIHVVRFCRQEQSYNLSTQLREEEERRVHRLTMELLAERGLPGQQRLDQLWGIDRFTLEPRGPA